MATTRKSRTPKLTPEQVAFKVRRDAHLAEIRQAITEGRAFLDTHIGPRKVVGYRDETGDAITSNGGYMDQRTFMVTLDDIRIG